MLKHSLLLFFTLISFLGIAQQRLELIVLDAHTGLPVPDAQVQSLAKGTVERISNKQGLVMIEKGDSVRVNHISYLARIIKLKPGKTGPQKIYLTPTQQELEEVVVTGQSRPTLASAAIRKVEVIDAKRIQKQAAVNLGDVLRNQLNFRVTEDGILGSQINLQGLSGAKVKILIDGVPMVGRLDGELDISQINLNDIERIELVEGPMSVQYGTDAVAGTINLISKRKATAEFSGQLNTYYENVGRYNADASLWFPLGNWHASVSLGRNFFDGFDPNPDARNLSWNPKEQYFGTLGLQRRFDNILLRYRGEYFLENIINRGAIGSIDSSIVPVDTGAWKYPRALDDYYQTTRINNAIYADYYLSEKQKIKGFLAYNYFRREKETLLKNLNDGEEQIFSGADAQDTSIFGLFNSRAFYSHNLLEDKFSYQVGYDASYEINQGQRIANQGQEITNLALFTAIDYQPLSWLELQPGFRYAYNSRFEAPLITSLATRTQLDDQWVFRASYGQGFRAPTLKELYFLFVDENHNILGNEELLAETSDNFQASLSFTPSLKNSQVRLEASGFFNDIQNEIRLIPVIEPTDDDPRGLFRNENIAQSQTAGGGFTAKYFYKNSLQIELGANAIGLRNNIAFSESAENAGENNFNFYGQYRLSASYTFAKIGLIPSLFVNYIGERQDLATNANGELINQTFEGYTLMDFTLQKTLLNNQLRLSAGIKNVLDITDQQVAGGAVGGGTHSAGSGSVPLSYGRSFFGRVQWSF